MLGRSAFALALVAACSAPSSPVHAPRPTTSDLPERFEDLTQYAAGVLFHHSPAAAVSLGMHRGFDGELPDRTPAARADEERELTAVRDALRARADAQLTPAQREDRDVLLVALGARLFDLVDRDVYATNPRAYLDDLNLDAYIVRDYAPARERAAATIHLCNGLGVYLQQARTNLTTPAPQTWIDTALAQTRGLAEFATKDMRMAFAQTDLAPAERTALDQALGTCGAALTEHATWLAAQHGTQAYALGERSFLAMLAAQEGITIDLPTLERLAQADLRRNLDALADAAHAIDPAKSVAEVVAAQAAARPTAANVLALADAQLATARAFMLDHHLASEPSTEVAKAHETPPFQRWNAAFLDSPGAFETKPLPSYYYITPPDPTWPAAEQASYLPPTADLQFTTVHEVYPGHFLHHLHIAHNPSRILRSFCTYSTAEGWAHYVEEMMFDAGLGGKTPQLRIGMLKEALLRDARFLAALGLHTHGMTVDEATRLFTEQAFVDPANARQQAVRGTFDPMYLSYTLGKLMIVKLRTDWLAANPGKTLGDFHDAFLAHACAPLPVIRRALLGDNTGPAL